MDAKRETGAKVKDNTGKVITSNSKAILSTKNIVLGVSSAYD